MFVLKNSSYIDALWKSLRSRHCFFFHFKRSMSNKPFKTGHIASKNIIIPKLEKWGSTRKIYYPVQKYNSQFIITLLRVLEIFMEQDPEIRKAGQCTESTSRRIIGNTRKYLFLHGRIAISSPLKNVESCRVVRSTRLINQNYLCEVSASF